MLPAHLPTQETVMWTLWVLIPMMPVGSRPPRHILLASRKLATGNTKADSSVCEIICLWKKVCDTQLDPRSCCGISRAPLRVVECCQRWRAIPRSRHHQLETPDNSGSIQYEPRAMPRLLLQWLLWPRLLVLLCQATQQASRSRGVGGVESWRRPWWRWQS